MSFRGLLESYVARARRPDAEPAPLAEIVAALENGRRGRSPGARLCRACTALLDVSGAGIMLGGGDAPGTTFGQSDAVVGRLQDLQFTLGEGPGIDAHTLGRPVFAPRLDDPVATYWPAFAPAAVAAGMLGSFGFPLRIGAVRLGALDLYRAAARSPDGRAGRRRDRARPGDHPAGAGPPGEGRSGETPA